jgi:hypothetical protein
MGIEEVKRKLNSIGKGIFIKYYEEFKNTNNDTVGLANKLLKENIKASSLPAQKTRITNARSIFKNNLQVMALKEVIGSNIKEEELAKAKILLSMETEQTN